MRVQTRNSKKIVRTRYNGAYTKEDKISDAANLIADGNVVHSRGFNNSDSLEILNNRFLSHNFNDMTYKVFHEDVCEASYLSDSRLKELSKGVFPAAEESLYAFGMYAALDCPVSMNSFSMPSQSAPKLSEKSNAIIKEVMKKSVEEVCDALAAKVDQNTMDYIAAKDVLDICRNDAIISNWIVKAEQMRKLLIRCACITCAIREGGIKDDIHESLFEICRSIIKRTYGKISKVRTTKDIVLDAYPEMLEAYAQELFKASYESKTKEANNKIINNPLCIVTPSTLKSYSEYSLIGHEDPNRYEPGSSFLVFNSNYDVEIKTMRVGSETVISDRRRTSVKYAQYCEALVNGRKKLSLRPWEFTMNLPGPLHGISV